MEVVAVEEQWLTAEVGQGVRARENYEALAWAWAARGDLAELAIEAFYPADETTRTLLGGGV
ncbi:MAG: hypothetical protein Q8O61_05910 [Nocardioides sp.]|nr:hypothetical protein [Nocardioides sp.]